MADRTPHRSARRTAKPGNAERKVAQYLEAHGLGNGRRNLAGYTRDHGDYGPVTDRDGDLWAIEIKGPGSQPQPGQVEAWAAEAARRPTTPGRPVGAHRPPARVRRRGPLVGVPAPVRPVGRHHRAGRTHRQRRAPHRRVTSPASPCGPGWRSVAPKANASNRAKPP